MISTTITKKNFEMKMQDLNIDGFFIEYKEEKPFWKKRLDNLLKEHDLRAYGLPEIVFLVGREPHRFRVVNIFRTQDIPEKYSSAINTEFAYALKCVPLTIKSIEEHQKKKCTDCIHVTTPKGRVSCYTMTRRLKELVRDKGLLFFPCNVIPALDLIAKECKRYKHA